MTICIFKTTTMKMAGKSFSNDVTLFRAVPLGFLVEKDFSSLFPANSPVQKCTGDVTRKLIKFNQL
jgi:hypothetical protein